MAPSAIVDLSSLTETQVPELPAPITDDIFQAALARSQHESDGEDPFEPQPKRFMQTEQQKTRQERELDERRVAWTLRKMKRDRKARQQRLKKQRQRNPPFEKLPSELILSLMQHTRLQDLFNLANSSAINRDIFRANERAIYRGIEIEQFPDWKWLFGDTMRRTSAQLQRLKDAVTVEYRIEETGAKYSEKLLELLGIIDNNQFTGMENVMFLQEMQAEVDMDIQAIESYTKKKIANRTAICLRSLGFQRAQAVKDGDRVETGFLCLPIPWEVRSQVIIEQTPSIQAEIRSIFMLVINMFYYRLEGVLFWWTLRHYSNPGNHRKPQEVKKWLSKLVIGLILNEVVPQWYSDTVGSMTILAFDEDSTYVEVADELIRLLNGHDQGVLDALQEIEEVVQFGRSIGLDLERLIDGRYAGDLVDGLGSIYDTPA